MHCFNALAPVAGTQVNNIEAICCLKRTQTCHGCTFKLDLKCEVCARAFPELPAASEAQIILAGLYRQERVVDEPRTHEDIIDAVVERLHVLMGSSSDLKPLMYKSFLNKHIGGSKQWLERSRGWLVSAAGGLDRFNDFTRNKLGFVVRFSTLASDSWKPVAIVHPTRGEHEPQFEVSDIHLMPYNRVACTYSYRDPVTGVEFVKCQQWTIEGGGSHADAEAALAEALERRDTALKMPLGLNFVPDSVDQASPKSFRLEFHESEIKMQRSFQFTDQKDWKTDCLIHSYNPKVVTATLDGVDTPLMRWTVSKGHFQCPIDMRIVVCSLLCTA